jgi:hypothetical protein
MTRTQTAKVQNLAKLMNVTEQQAYTFARCISYQMSRHPHLTIEQAVDIHMQSMNDMVRYAKEDRLGGIVAEEIYAALGGRK